MPYTGGMNATILGMNTIVGGTICGITAMIMIFYGIKLLAAMVSKFNIYCTTLQRRLGISISYQKHPPPKKKKSNLTFLSFDVDP